MPAAGNRNVAFLGITAIVLLIATQATASADSIYLKNGNVIRTSTATVDGNRIVFSQFGREMAIPMEVVDRVVEDDFVDPTPTPPTPQPTTAAAGGPDTGSAPDTGADPDVEAPEETPEYWQDRVREIRAERTELQIELERLRRIEQAMLHAHYSLTDVRTEIAGVLERMEANDRALPELRREARRNGVPAGWLRI